MDIMSDNSTSLIMQRHWPVASSSSARLPSTPAKDMGGLRTMPTPGMENKKPCDISNLMSPPEPTPYDSFNSAAVSTAKQSTMVMTRPGPNPPLSPPTSPARTAPLCPSPSTEATNLLDPALSQPIPIKDPILFPIVDKSMSPPAGPLFTSTAESLETIANTDRLVDEHIASRPASLFREVQPPRREEYKLALYFKTDVLSKFSQNPRGWLSQEKELLRADRKNTVIRPVHKLHTILPASTPTMPRLHMAKPSVNLNRVQKIKSPKLKTQNPRPIRATPTPCRQTIPVSATPEPRTRTVAPNREDKDFESLPDYCPPLSSLPNKSNSLKVDWKGNALDLSKDPHRHLLHDDEIHLAAGLRLDCATYLTSKRRIFMRRLDCAKIPKEFRKTDAQQACKIDVNKASKLWTAYDKVGWLDRKWVERFL